MFGPIKISGKVCARRVIDMDLLRLSEQMAKSKNPAKYHREFERAVKAGELVGVVQVAEKVKVQPAKKGSKPRELPDYAILPSPEYAAWHERALLTCNSHNNAPSFDALKTGVVNWEEAEQRTRKLLDRRNQRNTKLKQQRDQQKTTE